MGNNNETSPAQVNAFERFTNQYQLSKTLRFELKPVKETKDLVKEKDKNLLEFCLDEDKKLQKQYNIVKKLIDEYHKYFISKSLENFNLPHYFQGWELNFI